MRLTTQILLSLMLIVSLIACKDNDDDGAKFGSLKVSFKALYDGQPLKTFETVPFTGGQQVDFNTLATMITDMKLYRSGGEQFLDEAELINLSFDNDQDAAEGYVMIFNDLPAGSFDGIQFWVGVAPDLNEKVPADFPSSHPLSNTGYYWQAWDSYIFSKTEGRLDTTGTGPLNLNFSYHTGGEDLLLGLQGPIGLTISPETQETVTIYIDYKDLLNGIDIRNNPQNHNPEDSVQIGRIVSNLQTAVSLSH
jgi:hypothetical protein